MENLDNVFESFVATEENIVTSENETPKYIISHFVSANMLKVYLRIEILDKTQEIEIKYEDIKDYLSREGIVYGIQEDAIKDYCKRKEYSKELMAASGKDPVNGEDAQLIFDFDISKEKKFSEKEDGTIDYWDFNNIINVKKDTVLCHIIPEKEGKDGIDIYGNVINYKPGKKVNFNYGNNTYISKDGLYLLASTDGCVEYKNNKVFVDSVYKVNNVDNSTGNIDFIGNVIINGDVKAGFSVTAKGDINIRGMVEGAYIKSDGNVVISKGMNGRGIGSIYAKGDITSKYIENATIVSEKCVYSETLINSDVNALDSIILRGSSAAIIGGNTVAVNVIYAKTIGSKTNPETNITIDLTKYQEEQKLIILKKRLKLQLEKDLIGKNNEIKEIEEKIDLIQYSSLDNESRSNVQKQLLFMKIKINNEIYEIKRQLNEKLPEDNIANHKIICKGIIYPNTRITIGWMKYRVRDEINFSKMYNDGRDISIVPLNPGDLDL